MAVLRKLGSSLLAATFALVLAPGGVAAVGAPGCVSWQQVRTYAPPGFSMLTAVAAVSPTDAWAVLGGGGYEHDRGSGFSAVASPPLGTLRGGIRAVAGDASNDVWAVGESHPARPYAPTSTLAERYDGSRWSVVPSPSPDASSNVLQAVLALAPGDVWAVGRSGGRALVEHFTGSSWSVVAAPAPGSGSSLMAVAGAGPADIRAVGSYSDATGTHPLVVAYDGRGWAQEVVGGAPAVLTGIAHVPGTGHYVATGGSTTDRVLRFDGSAWTSAPGAGTPFPDSPGAAGAIAGVDALSDGEVWAVGSYTGSQSTYFADQPFALRWDGTRWTSAFTTFSVSHEASRLTGISHAGRTLFTAGSYSPTTTSSGETFAAALAC